MIAEATRESAKDSITSVRFARASFCQAAISSSSRISLIPGEQADKRLDGFLADCRDQLRLITS